MDVLKNVLGGIDPHQHFEPDTLPDDRSRELSDPQGSDRKPLGPFSAVLDLFDDGYVFVIDMPRDLPGHLNLLCRTKDRWLCFSRDSFHDPRLLTGEKEIETWTGLEGNALCIHLDKDAAVVSIERLRELQRVAGELVEFIAAHDEEWWEKDNEKQFPMLL